MVVGYGDTESWMHLSRCLCLGDLAVAGKCLFVYFGRIVYCVYFKRAPGWAVTGVIKLVALCMYIFWKSGRTFPSWCVYVCVHMCVYRCTCICVHKSEVDIRLTASTLLRQSLLLNSVVHQFQLVLVASMTRESLVSDFQVLGLEVTLPGFYVDLGI